jgi:hypothetical protein
MAGESWWRMKRTVLVATAVSLVAILLMVGCVNKADVQNTDITTPAFTQQVAEEPSAPEQIVGDDLRISVEEIDLAGLELPEPQGGIAAMLSWATPHDSLDDLRGESSDIIRGIVVDVRFAIGDGEPFTVVDVKVDEALKGNLGSGDLISIIQYGGYITIQEIVDSRDNGERFSGIPQEQWATTVIEKRLTDEPYPQAGDSFVYFLNAEVTELSQGQLAYSLPGQYYSRYKAGDDGVFTRAVTEDYGAEGPLFNSFTIAELRALLAS